MKLWCDRLCCVFHSVFSCSDHFCHHPHPPADRDHHHRHSGVLQAQEKSCKSWKEGCSIKYVLHCTSLAVRWTGHMDICRIPQPNTGLWFSFCETTLFLTLGRWEDSVKALLQYWYCKHCISCAVPVTTIVKYNRLFLLFNVTVCCVNVNHAYTVAGIFSWNTFLWNQNVGCIFLYLVYLFYV